MSIRLCWRRRQQPSWGRAASVGGAVASFGHQAAARTNDAAAAAVAVARVARGMTLVPATIPSQKKNHPKSSMKSPHAVPAVRVNQSCAFTIDSKHSTYPRGNRDNT